MFCPKCGAQVDGAFCPKCGNKMGEPTPASAQATAPVQNTAPTQAAAPKKAAPKINPMLIAVIAAAALVVIILIALVSSAKPTIKLDKYVTVEFEGYDSIGKAVVKFDSEAFDADYNEKLAKKLNKKAIKNELKTELGALATKDLINASMAELEATAAANFRSEIRGSLDKSTELSNGDAVTYTFDIDFEDLLKYYKVKLKYSEEGLPFTVAGLEQAGSFDPFEGFSLEYTGIGPDGRASINYNNNGDEYAYLNYKLDKQDGLSNGDVIKVTVEVSGSESTYVDRFGKLPYPREQEFTVEGLLSTIQTSEDVTDEFLTRLQSQSEDVIKAYVAKNWKEWESLDNITYLGNYLLTLKPGCYGDNNKIYLVYKLTSKATMDTEDDGIVAEDHYIYYFVAFRDLKKEADGTAAVDISNYETPNNGYSVDTDYYKADGWGRYDFYYRGYDSLDKLYNDVVTKNLENYSHEDNVTE